MRRFPDPDLAEPGRRTGRGYLLWLAGRQKRTMAGGALWDTVWLLGLALVPWAVGNAIDTGIIAGDGGALVRWALVILGLSLVRAAAEPMRDRTGVDNWNQAAFRSLQLLGRHATRTGQALTARRSVGEVAAVRNDAMAVGHVYYLAGGLTAALVSYATVAVILLRASVPLGLFVLLGVPVFATALLGLGRPLKRLRGAQRDASGEMTAVGADLVTGLRVLRGVGGEEMFARRYAAASDRTARAGLALATPSALVEGLQVLVGGLLVVGLTWFGGVLVARGQLRPGELVTFYGYAGFLVMPIRLIADSVNRVIPALVGAERIVDTLAILPVVRDDPRAVAAPAGPAPLVDCRTGLTARPGAAVGVVCARPDDAAAVLDRLGRFDDGALDAGPVRWGDVDTRRLPLAALRARIRRIDPAPHFFSGPLRRELDPTGRHADADIGAALHTAAADDVLDALPDGLDTATVEGGRTFSGGQRQRLGLARAVLSEAEILLLSDPTSAVDAHTEQRIADRLLTARAGRTTVVATTSPLLLRRLDEVHLLDGDRVLASGTHHELLGDPTYRAIVLRDVQ